MSLRDELESFRRFATLRIEQGIEDPSMEALLDLWRLDNPTPEMVEADRRAVAEAIRDFENGDRGIPLEELMARLRAKYILDLS